MSKQYPVIALLLIFPTGCPPVHSVGDGAKDASGTREDSALLDMAPLDTAQLDTAPLDTAQLDTARLDTAQLDAVVGDGAWDAGAVDGISADAVASDTVAADGFTSDIPAADLTGVQDVPFMDTSAVDARVADDAEHPDITVHSWDVSHLDRQLPVDSGLADVTTLDSGLADVTTLDSGLGTLCPAGDVPPWITVSGSRSHIAQCGGYTLKAQVVSDHMIRLRYQSPSTPTSERSFAVVGDLQQTATITTGTDNADSNSELFVLCTAQLRLQIDSDCHLQLREHDGLVLVEDLLGYSEDGTSGQRSVSRLAPGDTNYYGLGERTGGLEKRGKTYTFWNTDAYDPGLSGYGADTDPLYQSIPVLYGKRDGRAFGVFTDNSHKMWVDLAHTQNNQLLWTAAGGALDQYVIAGPSLAQVIWRYSQLVGTAPLPPRWALGFHQSRWGYPTQESVQSVLAEFRSRHIPADSIWLDIEHMDGYRSFTFHPSNFSDPQGLISYADGLDFKVVTIVDPGIKQDPQWDVYQTGVAGGHFLSWPDGTPYVGEVWPGAALFPDFSSAQTRLWWGGLVARPLAAGVRGIWIDMNEPSNFVEQYNNTVPNELLADGDGSATTMAEAHNVFGLNMARATYHGMLAAQPEQRPFILTRAGYAGIQRYAAVWTGDVVTAWDTLWVTLPMMLNLGLSGVPFSGSDIGGYSGNPSAELYARWMALGSISPFMRAHCTRGVGDQEPWAFGTEVEYIAKTLIQERYRLLPYYYSLAYQASQTGTPLLLPLLYHWPTDATANTLSDQATLGPWLLYAPVLEQGATTRQVYLPQRFMEYRSGKVYQGPGTFTVDVTLEALPAFVREGAIIPHGPLVENTGVHFADPLTLLVMPATDTSSFRLYEDLGDSMDHLSGDYRSVLYQLQETATGAQLTAQAPQGNLPQPARTLLVQLRPVDSAPTQVSLDGSALEPAASREALQQGTAGYFYDANDRSLWIAFADRAPFVLAAYYDKQLTEANTVLVPVTVTLPPETPADDDIHIATSATGWQQHQPLTREAGALVATGLVEVPRGSWFEYKYTRGNWSTVEKWTGCVETTNRYAFGAAYPGKSDHVDMWADGC